MEIGLSKSLVSSTLAIPRLARAPSTVLAPVPPPLQYRQCHLH
jgi:hypothetical protein